MKHISELTNSITPQPSSTASTDSPFSDEEKDKIKKLFLLMRATWGNKYTSNFTSPEDVKLAMRVWCQAFRNTDMHILHQSLIDLSKKLEWPPTVHEMHDHVKMREAQARAVETAYPQLPRMKRTEIAASALDEMRELLGVPNKT